MEQQPSSPPLQHPPSQSPQERSTGLMLARVSGGVALVIGAYLVLRPFIVPMLWAAIVAYITWPLFARVRDLTGRPKLVAALFTLSVLVVLGIPVAWFIVALADQGTQLARIALDWLEGGASLPAWLATNPWLREVRDQLEQLKSLAVPTDLTPYLARIGAQLSNGLVKLAGGLGRNIFAFGVTLIGLYALYVDGKNITTHARRLVATFLPATSPRFLEDVGAVVRAVVFGLVGTAITQGVLAGVGLALFDVPFAVALGALTAFLSFIPAGPVLVWGGASLWLLATGQRGSALGMALWGVLLVSSVDNVLRPVLISRSGSIRIPFLIVFFGVLGGLAAFGLLGLFVGPVLLSVAFALMAEFPQRRTTPQPSPATAAADSAATAPAAPPDTTARGNSPEERPQS